MSATMALQHQPRVKLSVLFITYNHERFIREALESVLAQRVNFNFEVVVAEDCSTDGTREVVLEFYRRHPDRIVPLLRDKNLGPGRSIREALEACCGEYVALLEGDDYWTCLDKLQRQVDFLDQHPDHTICCHRARIQDELALGQAGIFPSHDFSAGSYTIDDVISRYFVHTCTAVYRSGAIRPAPPWLVEVTNVDWALQILAARFGRVALMNDVMAVYRLHSGGIWSSKKVIDQKLGTLETMAVVDRETNFQFSRQIGRLRSRWYFEIAIEEMSNSRRMVAAKYLIGSLRGGGLEMSGRWRALAALAIYCVVGVKRTPSRCRPGKNAEHP